jgi:hypothetical protein
MLMPRPERRCAGRATAAAQDLTNPAIHLKRTRRGLFWHPNHRPAAGAIEPRPLVGQSQGQAQALFSQHHDNQR